MTNHRFRSRPTQRMRSVSAPDRLDRRSNVPTNLTEEQLPTEAEEMSSCEQQQLQNAFLPPNA